MTHYYDARVDREQYWQAVTAERLSLADLMADLPDERWERPSLCDGWRIRDVAAHLRLGADPLRWSTRLAWIVRKAGRFHPLNRDVAIHYAAQPTEQLSTGLREHAASRRLPVPLLTNHRTALLDVLVHGQDIAIPLGIDRPMPPDAARSAAITAWAMGWPFWARRRLHHLHVRATDADWAVGDGPVVEGPIAAVLLLLTGRAAALRMLTGPGLTAAGSRFST